MSKQAPIVKPGHAFLISKVWGSRHGGSIYFQALASELVRSGWEITVLAQQFDQAVPGAVPLNGFFRRAPRFWLRKIGDTARLWRIAGRTARAMIVVQGDLPRLTYILLQRFVPLMFIRQDGILTCPGNNRFQEWTRSVCRRPLGVSCLRMHSLGCVQSGSLAKNFGRLVLRLRDGILVRGIRHFVSNSRYIAEVHRKPGNVLYPPRLTASGATSGRAPVPQRDLHRMVFCGRLEPVKGPEDALSILSLLPDCYYLEVLGDGPLRPGLARRADLELPNRVGFHGWVEPAARDACLASAGALLIPSLWDEAFSMAGVEALAAGTPVVGYDVGGISEWCRHGAGILVAVGHVGQAALAVRALTAHPRRWLAASQAAKNVAAQLFPVDRFSRELHQLLAIVTSSRTK